jgi:HEPN domain-containing protein
MTRRDLRELALLRLREAGILLRNGHHDGAHYLSGYIIECALKACIAKQTQRHQFPDKKTADASHTHKLEDLLRVAQLGDAHREEVRANLIFEANWNVVRDWSEQSRYRKHSREAAEAILVAISDKKHGVLKWIKQHW